MNRYRSVGSNLPWWVKATTRPAIPARPTANSAIVSSSSDPSMCQSRRLANLWAASLRPRKQQPAQQRSSRGRGSAAQIPIWNSGLPVLSGGEGFAPRVCITRLSAPSTCRCPRCRASTCRCPRCRVISGGRLISRRLLFDVHDTYRRDLPLGPPTDYDEGHAVR